MSTSMLQSSIDGSVGIIELARPDRFNCLSTHLLQQIKQVLDEWEENPAVRAVLLCSQGKNFCTGAELTEVKAVRADSRQLASFIEQGHQVMNAIEDSRLPVVVAAQGLCLAGGLELMMACDVTFAGRSARFGDQHGQFGLVPGWGGSQRLPHIVGMRRAMDLFFSAKWIDAQTAERWGLVNYVVEDASLRDEALAYCKQVAERSAAGIALMKRLARSADFVTMRAALEKEALSVTSCLISDDVTEGLAAFKERRKPVFG